MLFRSVVKPVVIGFFLSLAVSTHCFPRSLQEFLFTLAISLAMVCITLFLPKPTLRWIGGVCSPNLISIYRVPLTWLAFGLDLLYSSTLTLLLLVLALLFDSLDGRVARAGPEAQPYPIDGRRWQESLGQLWTQLHWNGMSESGKWIDPLGDKLTVPVMILVLSYCGYIDLVVAIGVVLVDFVGQSMRSPMRLIPKRFIRGDKATWAGKIKFVCQCVTLLGTLILMRPWLDQIALKFGGGVWVSALRILPEVTAKAAFVFGILSVASRLRWPWEQTRA